MFKAIVVTFALLLAIAVVTVPILLHTPNEDVEAVLTAEEMEIRDKTIAAYDELKTCEFDLDMVMEMRVTGLCDPVEMIGTIVGEGAIDDLNRRMRMDIEMDVEMTGEVPDHVQAEMYIVDDYVYMNMVAPGETLGWVKYALPEGYWEEMNIPLQQVDILRDAEVDLVGTQIVDGTECYVLDVTPSLGELWAMVELGSSGEALFPGLDPRQFISDFSATQWVTKDTFFTPRLSMSMQMVFTPESLGMPPEMAEDFDGWASLEMTLRQRNVNQPVTVELPPGAEDAAEVPVPM